MSVDEKATRLRADVSFLYDRAQSTVGAIEFIRVADAVLQELPPGSDDLWIMKLSAWATLEFFAMRTARALDPAEPGNASLPGVFALLADLALRDTALRQAAEIVPTAQPQQEMRMNSATKRWQGVAADPRRERLRELRSHTLAHNLVDKTIADGLAGGMPIPELVAYADEVTEIIGDLAAALLGVSALDEVRRRARKSAESFWQKLTAH